MIAKFIVFTAISLSLQTAFADIDSADCKAFLKDLPQSVQRDWIEVPEDYKQPDGRKIQIFYYGDLSAKNPIAFFNGGPGGNGFSAYKAILDFKKQRPDYANLPFIFIGQRGTGCSSSYPEGSSPEALERTARYGSTEIVWDAEEIRKKLLGPLPWKIFGQSYGAFVVHRYVALAPQSLLSATAHGGVIPPDPIENHANRLLAQNRGLLRFFNAYPAAKKRIEVLNRFAEQGKCFSDKTGKHQACSFRTISRLVDYVGFPDTWPRYADLLKRIVPSDQVNEVELQKYLDRNVFTSEPGGMFWTQFMFLIGWVDRNSHPKEVIGSYNHFCARAYANLENRGERPLTWLLNDCITLKGGREEFDLPLDVREKIKSLPQDVLTLEAFKLGLPQMKGPFYLYSGEKDAYTPPESFSSELATVGDLIQYTHFQNSGHEGFYTEELVYSNLAK